jgi:galactose mutarotase-like enzyme
VLTLRGGSWEVRVLPERGGRIGSIRLRDTELLDQGIGVDDPTADGFVEAGAWGWDEMVPNVNADGLFPDHGEAWRLPWVVEERSDRAVSMRCSGSVVPWGLERRIELGEGAVRVEYLYTNLGSEPHHAYWCAHPLFRFEAGMGIGVPGGEALSHMAEGASTKVFLPEGSVDHARLVWQSGVGVDFAWDVGVTPHVGVWVCNGGLRGYRHVAVEPATGAHDVPGTAPLLGPGEQLSWWLEVRDVGPPALTA